MKSPDYCITATRVCYEKDSYCRRWACRLDVDKIVLPWRYILWSGGLGIWYCQSFATFLVLIKFLRILFIIIWNVTRELVSLKNITIGLNNPSSIVNTIFYFFSSFICILLYLYHKSNFVNTFLVLEFFTISEIRGKG